MSECFGECSPSYHFSFVSNSDEPNWDIATGLIFPSGRVALETTKDRQLLIYDDLPSACHAHCRDGKVQLIWGYVELNRKDWNLPMVHPDAWGTLQLPADSPLLPAGKPSDMPPIQVPMRFKGV
jgi:hypothetical protein